MELLINAGRHEIEWITPDALSIIEVRKLIRMGHEYVLEHGSACVRFKGVSRGLTHELVRHRLASFTQESTRYVDEREFRFVVPPQDTHQVLPTAIESEIVVTANFREWRHVLCWRPFASTANSVLCLETCRWSTRRKKQARGAGAVRSAGASSRWKECSTSQFTACAHGRAARATRSRSEAILTQF